MVAAAVIGGAALSTAGSLASGAMQSGNVGKAAATSQRNLELMLPQIQQNYVNQQGLFQPYATAGGQGLQASTDLLGLNGPDAAAAAMSRFQTSPGYQFQMEQGLRAIDAGAAAGRTLPGVRSGATIKAEEAYGQGLANQDFGNYFTRINALASLGDTAAQQLASSGNSLIAGMQGNATGQNQIVTGAANAQNSILGNTAGGIGNTVNSLLQNKDVQSLLFGPSTTGNLSNYAQTPASYQAAGIAPGFNIGTDINAPSYWPGQGGTV